VEAGREKTVVLLELEPAILLIVGGALILIAGAVRRLTV
jgi:hypothetical protein